MKYETRKTCSYNYKMVPEIEKAKTVLWKDFERFDLKRMSDWRLSISKKSSLAECDVRHNTNSNLELHLAIALEFSKEKTLLTIFLAPKKKPSSLVEMTTVWGGEEFSYDDFTKATISAFIQRFKKHKDT